MTKNFFLGSLLVLFSLGNSMELAWGHVTPNVRLHTIREAVQRLLPQGRLFVKEVRLTEEQKSRLKALDNWDTQNDRFKFFISRDNNKRLNRVMISMIEFTRHGPVVVAVALNADGRVAEALITDLQMESVTWVDPILKTGFMNGFKGKDSRMKLTLESKWASRFTGLTRDFARIIANAVKKSAQLFEVVFK